MVDEKCMLCLTADEGTNWHDQSGRGHDGTVSGSYVVYGERLGIARYFDNIDDKYTVTDHADVDLLDAFSIEAWFKVTNLASGWGTIIAKWNAPANKRSYILQTNNTELRFYTSVDGINVVLLDLGTPVTGKWQQVVITGLSGGATYGYVDAALEKTGALAADLFQTDVDFTVGDFVANEPFDGLIDEVRLWKRVLTPEEIRDLYEAGRPGE